MTREDRDRLEALVGERVRRELAATAKRNELLRRLRDEATHDDEEGDLEAAFCYMLGRGPHPLLTGRRGT